MSETAIRSKSSRELARRPPGRPRHSDESTTSRSQTSTSCSSSGSPQGGRRASGRTTGRSVIRSGATIDAGRPRALAAQAELDHLGAHLALDVPPTVKHCKSTWTSIPSRRVGLGEEQDRPRRVPLLEPGQRLARSGLATPAAPRRRASSRSSAGRPRRASRAQRRQLALDLGDDRINAASSDRPSRWISSSAARRAPGARPRSSGTTGGRASTRRRSSRRAPTAPRPRPRA